MDRRKFIKNSLFVGTGLTIGLGIYSYQIEPFWLEFVQTSLPIKNLPKDIIGKKLMQISDIHIGNRFDYSYIIESLIEAKKFNPDFVVYTGDYISYENDEQIIQLNEVMKHFVYGKEGTVAILGNHDYGINWSQESVSYKISKLFLEKNINLLRNESLNISGLNFIGFDDYWGLNFDPSKAISKYDPHLANLVLCHNPDVCDLNFWDDYEGWILSGHTHGGQVKAPFLIPPQLPVKNKRYSSGKIKVDKLKNVYINRALGHLWQVRFNVRPEITIFKLERERKVT